VPGILLEGRNPEELSGVRHQYLWSHPGHCSLLLAGFLWGTLESLLTFIILTSQSVSPPLKGDSGNREELLAALWPSGKTTGGQRCSLTLEEDDRWDGEVFQNQRRKERVAGSRVHW
jgi:hypothetical protein